jgi:hypothetical protein
MAADNSINAFEAMDPLLPLIPLTTHIAHLKRSIVHDILMRHNTGGALDRFISLASEISNPTFKHGVIVLRVYQFHRALRNITHSFRA